ncbi:hypothetical protein C0J45_11608 [Silurus meridionalis]|nr:hypothetical protein C0J45_11608 [Silurus meridionalis]
MSKRKPCTRASRGGEEREKNISCNTIPGDGAVRKTTRSPEVSRRKRLKHAITQAIVQAVTQFEEMSVDKEVKEKRKKKDGEMRWNGGMGENIKKNG